MPNSDNLIFLSYASPDKDRALHIYDALKSAHLNVWIDDKNLLPGQNWDFEIKRALDKSDCIVILVSNHSFNKRGYVQREIKIALDKLSEKLVDDIYIIPVLLDDDVLLPEQLKHIQSIKISDKDSYQKIRNAIKYQLDKLGKASQEMQREKDVYWTYEEKTETWDGLPGYSVELQIPTFHSTKYANLSDIGEHIRGHFILSLLEHRSIKLSQMPEFYNYGQNRFYRTNTYDAHCREPIIKGKVLSIQYAVHWYGAGAAHPNSHFMTFSYVLEPLFFVQFLQSIFADPLKALSVIQTSVRRQLYKNLVKENPNPDEVSSTKERIDDGTKSWKDFQSFVFADDGIELFFPPYQVASYADGTHFATVQYGELLALMRSEYKAALSLSIR